MNNNTKIIFSFVLGAAAGAVVSWKILENRFEKKFIEEVELEREAYERRLQLRDEYSAEEKDIREKAADLASKLGYTGEEETNVGKPEVIHPDKYAEIEEYDIQSLIYYDGDKVLTDDYNHRIEDIEDMVGLDFAEHFGEYEEDSVFIRNDRYKTYYEICRDLGNFSDVAEVE